VSTPNSFISLVIYSFFQKPSSLNGVAERFCILLSSREFISRQRFFFLLRKEEFSFEIDMKALENGELTILLQLESRHQGLVSPENENIFFLLILCLGELVSSSKL